MTVLPFPLRSAAIATAGGLACWTVLALASSTIVPPDPGASGPSGLESAAPQQMFASTSAISPDSGAESVPVAHAALKPAVPASETPVSERLVEQVSQLTTVQQQLEQEVRLLRQQLADTAVDSSKPDLARLEQQTAEWTAAIARLERQDADLLASLASLQQRLQDWKAEMAAAKTEADTSPMEPLVTKLYQPLTASLAELEPLVMKLLTPDVGFVGSIATRDGFVGALLVRDHAPVLEQIDRLMQELDRPLPGLEIDVAVQEIDNASGTARSLATPVPPEQIQRDGPSLIIPEGDLFLPPRIVEQPQETRSMQRVIRITPRLVH